MNHIKESEISRFVPCKLSDCEYEYTHFNDCKMSGCDGHKTLFQYYSVTDSFSMDFGDGSSITLDGTQMQLVNDWLEKLKS